MKNPDGKLDRHKVAACYLIAIASIRPMRFVIELNKENKKVHFSLNEKLAITTALSLLRAFFIAATEENKELSNEEKGTLIYKFDKGIAIPDENLINHGEYINNYANEIRFSIADGSISILSIAHELYLLEVLTKMK